MEFWVSAVPGVAVGVGLVVVVGWVRVVVSAV